MVVAKGGGVERTTLADNAGCYELKELPPASYRVTARLAGFNNATRDRLGVTASNPTRLDFTMLVSAMCECLVVTGSLAEHWNHADAVLHLRLLDPEYGASTPGPSGVIFVSQNQQGGVDGPYDVGQELVAFLRLSSSSRADSFHFINDTPGLAPAMAFLVQDGRIQRAPPEFSRYVAMPLAAFLEELRTLSRHR
jgi:hypothetical protein